MVFNYHFGFFFQHDDKANIYDIQFKKEKKSRQILMIIILKSIDIKYR